MSLLNKEVLSLALEQIYDSCFDMLKEADSGTYVEDRLKHLMEVVDDLNLEVNSYV